MYCRSSTISVACPGPVDGSAPSDRPADFDLPSAWRDLTNAFERSLARGEARIRIAAGAADRLDRLGAAAIERFDSAPRAPDGSRTVTIPIETVGHAAGLLLGFADEIEVLEPLALREELRRRAGRVHAMYG